MSLNFRPSPSHRFPLEPVGTAFPPAPHPGPRAVLSSLSPSKPFVDADGPWKNQEELDAAVDAAAAQHPKKLRFLYARKSEGGYITSEDYTQRFFFEIVE